MKNVVVNNISYIKYCLSDMFYLKKVFKIIFFSYLILYLPLFIVNFTYIDDNMRVVTGGGDNFVNEGGWVFASLIMRLFSGGTSIMYDTSPLRQIVFIFFCSLSSCMLIHLFCEKRNINFFIIISSLIIGITPTAIRLISHKYDSAHYGFAIFASIFPFIFYKKNNKLYFIFSIIFVSISMMSYHAMSGIYPVIVIFLSLFSFSQNEDCKKILFFILKSLLAYLISLFIYGIVLSFIDFARGIVIDNVENNMFINFINSHITINTYLINNDFGFIKYILIFLIIIFLLIYIYRSKNNKILSFIFLLLSLLLVAIVQFGYSPFIHNKYVSPYDISLGYLYGYSITLSIIMIFCVSFDYKFNFSHLIAILLILYFSIYAIVYDSLLLINKKKGLLYVSNIAKDISSMDIVKEKKVKKIYFQNDFIDLANLIEVKYACDILPLFSIVPIYFSSSWPHPLFLYYYFDNDYIKLGVIADPGEYLDDTSGMELYVENDGYKILINDKNEMLILTGNNLYYY